MELNRHAKFQLPRFRVSLVSSQDSRKGEANQAIQTKPNIHQTEPSKKLCGLSYFCELSLNAQFQLPRLYVSCISTQESSFARKKKFKRKGSFRLNFFLGKFFSVTTILDVNFFGKKSIFVKKNLLTKFFLGQFFFAKIFLLNFFC